MGAAFSTLSYAASGKTGHDANDPSPVVQALAGTVLKMELFADPVLIDRMELLRLNDNFICRVTSTDGAERFSVSNNMQMIALYPIFT